MPRTGKSRQVGVPCLRPPDRQPVRGGEFFVFGAFYKPETGFADGRSGGPLAHHIYERRAKHFKLEFYASVGDGDVRRKRQSSG